MICLNHQNQVNLLKKYFSIDLKKKIKLKVKSPVGFEPAIPGF